MMDTDFPFRFDGSGRTALTDEEGHVRDMIEQVLFTAPGERVNRPEFGSGLLQMVFAPNSPEIAAAMRFTLQAALQQWLADLIEIRALEVVADEATFGVRLDYVLRRTGDTRTDVFLRGAP